MPLRPLPPLIRIPGRRSTLHAWYVREWEVLRGGSINWTWLMGEIAKRGLTDRCGRLPTLQTARQTWYRVKGEIERRHKTPQPDASPPRPKLAPTIPVKSPPLTSFAPPSAKDPTDAQAVYRRSVPAK